jgi:hypothetical protein
LELWGRMLYLWRVGGLLIIRNMLSDVPKDRLKYE